MERLQVDPEEMERRQDKDFIASLKMVGEGAPVFDLKAEDLDEEEVQEERELPRDYQ